MRALFFLLLPFIIVAAEQADQKALSTETTTVRLDPKVWFKNPSVSRTICTDDEMSYVLNAMAQPLNEPLVAVQAASIKWVTGYEHTRRRRRQKQRGLRGSTSQEEIGEERELFDCEGICGNGSQLCGWLCSMWRRRRQLQVTFEEGVAEEEQNRELDALTTSLQRSLRDVCRHTKNAKASELSSACAWAITRANCYSEVRVV